MQTTRIGVVVATVAVAVVAMVTMTSCQQTSNDQTVQPEAKGSSVVEMSLDRISTACIFSDDKLLMRRIAYVESSDGGNPDTFRDGYYGGIWQVDQNMFDVTQSAPASSVLQTYFSGIKSSFGFDWSSVRWQDLTKPLYSALGARLFLQYEGRTETIPRDIDGQANYWKKYYRTAGNASEFVADANRLENGCQSTVGADIIFVLDGSGSVGSTNFNTMKNFVKDVVKGFDVGLDQTRFGVIKYSTNVKTEFNLKTYSTVQEVLNAVDMISYTGGGTNTHMALDELRLNGFSEASGARPSTDLHPRVAIVLTDGQSNYPQSTITAALRVQDAGITAFGVGVGSNIYVPELEVIASDPTCLYIFLLKDFKEVESLKYAIEKRTCEAPVIIAQNSTTGGRLPAGGDQNCKIKVPVDGATIQLGTDGGTSTFYTSMITYPSADYYDQKVDSLPGRPGVLYVPQPPTADAEGIVYCSIKGDELKETNISIGIQPGDQDKCKNNDCENGATCYHTSDSYGCDCPIGYTGQKCETVIDNCENDPCLAGVCTDLGQGFECKCDPGWSGVYCDIPINYCSSNPCFNGECKPLANGYECCCDQGYTGQYCENEIDECHSNPCVRGECVDHPNKYVCDCPPGFTGIHCEIDIDECASDPCVNGDCSDLINGYVCNCLPGWTDNNCVTDIEECASNPCHYGDCEEGVNHYNCTCYPGWSDTHCETDIDECASNPCMHGTCQDLVNAYECVCRPGWTGIHCDIDIDECASNPCLHGTCHDGINHYTCACEPGYTGPQCETEIDECESNPCLNGQCRDRVDRYECICDSGWTGTHCETDIDECASSPCVNGKCSDLVDGYVCSCDSGWEGIHCDCVTDNCLKLPCKNGICENLIGGFTCMCMHGFTGDTCETPIVGYKKFS